jgi:hypothetical protein
MLQKGKISGCGRPKVIHTYPHPKRESRFSAAEGVADWLSFSERVWQIG